MSLVFWDSDTQVDFLDPAGSLPVPGASEIRPRLARLTLYARERGVRVLGSVEFHHPDDEELAGLTDDEILAPHALRGTAGVEKVPETAPIDPWWVESVPWPPAAVADEARRHAHEIYFRKNRWDVFTNPNVGAVLEAIAPGAVVVYGAAADLGARGAVEGLRSRGYSVAVVEDAMGALDPTRGRALLEAWERNGVRRVTTDAVVSGRAVL